MTVPVPPEYQAIVFELESRAAPKANGTTAAGEALPNGSAAAGAATTAAANGVTTTAVDGGKDAPVWFHKQSALMRSAERQIACGLQVPTWGVQVGS